MARMVRSDLSFVLPLIVESLAGNQLEHSVNHLIPSLEVSQITMCECTYSHAVRTERPA
jgi:hypothetical protein